MDSTPTPTTVPPRPEARRAVGSLVIATAVAMSLGLALKMPTQITANDISRYCTVWALLERGTYAIDDCPWQQETQDKVRKPAPGAQVDPATGKVPDSAMHFYSSKPPLLATLIAGLLYPVRAATGVPLDRIVEQPRLERNVEEPDPDHPGKTRFVKQTPKPSEWPTYILYLKPATVLLNIVPFWIFLALYARLLDRYATNDWAWCFSMIAGAFGTLLFVFNSTLNNHTLAAYSGFFAIYALIGILDGARRPGPFAAAGFFGAFCACSETPAALFGMALAGFALAKSPRLTLAAFVPAALVPLAAFFATQYLSFGQFRLVYEEFGTQSYTYEGSYWNTPLEFDYFNLHPEPTWVYLFHMTLGHHGVFSLTPVFLLSAWAMLRNTLGRDRPLRAVSATSLVLTVVLVAFYARNPLARNYGGSTSGLRWLFWLIPFWLVVLPTALDRARDSRVVRGTALVALALSALTVGYALRNPWNHPWTTDLLEHLNLYPLVR